jgi:myosin protein heavy chain
MDSAQEDLQLQASLLQSEISALKGENNLLNQKLDNVREELAEALSEKSNATTRIRTLEETLKSTEDQIRSQESEIDHLKAVEERIELLEKQLQDVENNRAQLTDEIERRKEEESRLKLDIEYYKTQPIKSQDLVTIENGWDDDFPVDDSNFQSDLTAPPSETQELSQLREVLSEQQDVINKLLEHCSANNVVNWEIRIEDSTQLNFESVKRIIDQLVLDRAALNTQVDQDTNKIDELNNDRLNLRTLLEEERLKTAELEEAQKSSEANTEVIEQLKAKVSDLTQQLASNDLEQDDWNWTDRQEETRETLASNTDTAADISKLQEERDSLKTQLKENEKALERVVEEHTERLDSLRHQIHQSEESRTKLEEQLALVHEERDMLKIQFGDLSKQVEQSSEVVRSDPSTSTDSTVAVLEERIEKLSEDNSKLLLDLETLRKQLDTFEEAKRSAISQICDTFGLSMEDEWDLSEYFGHVGNILSELRSELAQKEDSESRLISAAKEKFDTILEEKGALESQIQSLRDAGATVVETLKKLEAENDALIAENESLIIERDSINEEKEHLVSENRALLDNVSSSSSDSEELRERVAHLERERESLERDYKVVFGELSLLRDESSVTVAKLSDAELQIESLQQQVTQLEAHIESLKSAGLSIVSLKETLEAENEDLRNQIAALKEAGAAVFADRQQLEEEADTLAGQIDVLNIQVTTLTDERSRLENQLKAEQTRYEELSSLQNEESEKYRTLSLQFKEFEAKSVADIQELVETLRNVTEGSSDLKTELRSLKTELEEALSAKLAASNDAAISRSAESKLKEELESIMTELEYQRGQTADFDSLISSLATEKHGVEAQLHDVQAQLVDAQQQLSSMQDDEAEVTELRSQVAALQDQLKESDDRYDNLLEAGETHSLQLETQLENALAEWNRLKAERDDLIHELSNLSSKVETLEPILDSKTSEIDSLMSEIMDLRTQLSTNQQSVEELSRHSMLENQELEGLRVQVRELDLNLEQALSRSNDLEQTILPLQTRLRELESEANATSFRAESLQQELSMKSSNLMALENELASSKLKIAELEQELSFKTSELSSLERNLIQSSSAVPELQQRISELQSERHVLEERIQSISFNYEEALKAKDESMRALEEEMYELSRSRKVDVEEFDLLVSRNAELEAKLQQLNADVESLHVELGARESDSAAKTAELSQLRGQFDEIQRLLEQYAKERDEAYQRLATSEHDMQILSRERDELTEQMNYYASLHTSSEEQLNMLQNREKAVSEEKAALEYSIYELNSKMEMLSRENQALISSSNKLQQDIVNLEKRLSFAERDVSICILMRVSISLINLLHACRIKKLRHEKMS